MQPATHKPRVDAQFGPLIPFIMAGTNAKNVHRPKLLVETAVCLLQAPHVPAGMWTPGAALQRRLIEALRLRAGLRFVAEN